MVQEQPIKRQRSISERPIVRDSDSFIDDDNINEQEEEEEEEEVYYASTTNKQKRRQQCHFTSPEPNSPSSKAVTRRKTYANPNKRDHKIGRTPIYKAARNGHLEQVKALVEAGAHVNITDNANWTPLHEAAESCQFEVAQYLMECGAKVNVRGHESTTPLHDACIAKDAHAAALVVKLLVDGGANAFAMNNRHQRPIDLCIEKNNEACQAILQARIMELEHDIIQKDSQGKSLLHYACYNNKYEKAQDLIKKGADVNCQDNQDITPLQLACAQGHLDIVKLLIEQGGALLDLLDNTENGDSPLHYASRNGRKNIVEYLLNQAKAEVNIRNKQDQDAYHVSAAHPPVRQILTAKMDESKYEELAIDSLDDNARGLKKQIEPERPLTREERKIQKEMESFEKMEGRSFSSDNKADNFIDDDDTSTTKRRTKRQTTRSASVQERDIVTATKNNKISASRSATPTENVKLDLLKRDASNSTNLHIFAGQDDCGKMGYLLNKDVDPNVKNNYGWTPLHEASLKGKVNAVKMLLKYGADVDAKSRDKDTPLHDAVENNQCQVVELLLEYGADLFAKNRHGADSIEIATQHGFQDILLVLRKKQKMILGEDYDEDEQVDLKSAVVVDHVQESSNISPERKRRLVQAVHREKKDDNDDIVTPCPSHSSSPPPPRRRKLRQKISPSPETATVKLEDENTTRSTTYDTTPEQEDDENMSINKGKENINQPSSIHRHYNKQLPINQSSNYNTIINYKYPASKSLSKLVINPPPQQQQLYHHYQQPYSPVYTPPPEQQQKHQVEVDDEVSPISTVTEVYSPLYSVDISSNNLPPKYYLIDLQVCMFLGVDTLNEYSVLSNHKLLISASSKSRLYTNLKHMMNEQETRATFMARELYYVALDDVVHIIKTSFTHLTQELLTIQLDIGHGSEEVASSSSSPKLPPKLALKMMKNRGAAAYP